MAHDDTTRSADGTGRAVTFTLPKAARAARVMSAIRTSGLVLAIADGRFTHDSASLWAVVVLHVSGMAHAVADRALRRR
ncbi:hypothetical protein [Streptomyces sp. NPDC006997]|uniref:hypothetical protein n=1 Tax=Streptomyces sp. NPDC006997 TaxID=3155356 RepID=UPI0033E4DE41